MTVIELDLERGGIFSLGRTEQRDGQGTSQCGIHATLVPSFGPKGPPLLPLFYVFLGEHLAIWSVLWRPFNFHSPSLYFGSPPFAALGPLQSLVSCSV